jgi:hypothetical protein
LVIVVAGFSIGFTVETLRKEYQMTGNIIALQATEVDAVATKAQESLPEPEAAPIIEQPQATSTPLPEWYGFSFYNDEIMINAGSNGLMVEGLPHNVFTEDIGNVVIDDSKIYEGVKVFITWADGAEPNGQDIFTIEVEGIMSVICNENICEKPYYFNIDQ